MEGRSHWSLRVRREHRRMSIRCYSVQVVTELLDPVIGVDVEKDSDKEFSWDSILDDDDNVDDDNETDL